MHGVRSTCDGFDDRATRAHRTISDHVDVAASRLIHVVASSRGNVSNCRRHWHSDTEDVVRCVSCAAAESDENPSRTGPHEMKGCPIGRAATHDDGHIELKDELFEIQRLTGDSNMLGADRRAADDEYVHPSIDHGGV